MRAAEARAAPVIVLVGPGSFAAEGGERLLAAFRAAAEQAPVPVLVQLDHAADRELIGRAAAAGVDAVMADGSRLPYEREPGLLGRRGGRSCARSASRSRPSSGASKATRTSPRRRPTAR